VLLALTDPCGASASATCTFVFRRTDNEVLARAADWLIAKPLRIGLVLLLALVASRLLERVIGRFIAGVEGAAVRSAADTTGVRARQRAATIGAVLRSLAKAVIFVIAALMILGELDLDLAPLLAGAGIVGVAAGFGAQTLVRDFLAGMFMLIEDQYGVGDVIDVGEAKGRVEGLSLRTTRIRDADGVIWYVPNGEIKRVANRSQDPA
jgi:small conductance mechanosensitive channel